MTRPRVAHLALAVALFSLPAGSAVFGQTVGSVVNTSKLAGSQSEEEIGIDPTNPQRLFVLSNNNTGAGMFAAYSTDGGTTWTGRLMADGTDGLPKACCDPAVSWDQFGNLFVSYLDATLSKAVLVLSTNGGVTFNLVNTWPAMDQPHLATGAGSVWVNWNNGSAQAVGAPVTGLGTVGAFIAVQTLPGSVNGNFGGITIGPSGQVLVAFQNAASGVGPDKIMVSLDPDGLGPLPFAAPVLATNTNAGGFYPVPPQNDRTVDASGLPVWDRSGGTFNGRVYLAYVDAPAVGSADSNVFFRYSNDNGSTWSAPVRVNDDTGSNSQFFPRSAVDQTTGNLVVSWYDARNSPTNTTVQFYAAVSTNGGVSFQPNIQVTSGFSNAYDPASANFPGLGPAGFVNFGNQYGDYSGLAFHGGVFYPTWADNSNSTGDNPNGAGAGFNIYTAKVVFSGSSGGGSSGEGSFAGSSGPAGGEGSFGFGVHPVGPSSGTTGIMLPGAPC